VDDSDACEQCSKTTGVRYWIRDIRKSVASHVLHDGDCAAAFFGTDSSAEETLDEKKRLESEPAPKPAAEEKRPELKPDRDEAERHLTALDPTTDRFTFQTFDDNGKRKDRSLARVLHGTLAQHFNTLVKLNNRGAGIFVCVNVTDFKGRKEGNIIRVRAGFGDLDGAPLEPVLADGEPKPHIIVESSLARFHPYYIIGDDMPSDQFGPLQRAIAAHFGGDPSVHDLPRVMRIAGFIHRKSEPFLSRLVQTNDHEPYKWSELCRAFSPTRDNGEQLNFTRKSVGSNGGEAKVAEELDDPARYKIAEGLEDLPLGNLAEGLEDREAPPLDFAPIKEGCPWLRHVHDTGGIDQSEVL
jgi:hypothetical protein